MEQVSCSACGGMNEAGSSFCRYCGAAVAPPAATTPDAAGPSGWAMATSGMGQPPPPASAGTGTGSFQREQLAGWWARFGASILDNLILGGLILIVVVLVFGIGWVLGGESFEASFDSTDPYASDSADDLILALFGFAVLALIGLVLAWETWWIAGKHQGTPGMLAVGFRVTDDMGERVSKGRALGRAVAKILLYQIPYIGSVFAIASAFTIGLSSRRQGVHDMIAGTICVDKSALEMRALGLPPVAAGSIVPSYAMPAAHLQPPQGGIPGMAPPAPPPTPPPPTPPPHESGPFV